MKKARKMLAGFFAIALALAITPAAVYAIPPTIGESSIPLIIDAPIFGISATAATAEVIVDFGGWGGTVYILLLRADEALPALPDDDALMADLRTSEIVCNANESVVTLPLMGMMPETEYIACFLAKNDGGQVRWDTDPFTTLPGGGGAPPVIDASPANMSIENDIQAVFTVQTSDDGLQYQWQSTPATYGYPSWHGGLAWVNLQDGPIWGVDGANTDTLTIAADMSREWYNTAFRCILTNAAGSAISDYAVLTVHGRWPILESVGEVDIEPHYPIGAGMNAGNRFEAKVTVPHTTSALEGTDFSVDNVHMPNLSISLFSDASYTRPISSQPLSAGLNNVYFAINMDEGTIYYYVAITRENDSSSSSSNSGGSSVETPGSTSSAGAEENSGAPQTSDNNNTGLWFILLAMSVIGILSGSTIKQRKSSVRKFSMKS